MSRLVNLTLAVTVAFNVFLALAMTGTVGVFEAVPWSVAAMAFTLAVSDGE